MNSFSSLDIIESVSLWKVSIVMKTNNLSGNFFPPAIAWITPLIFFPIFGRNDSFTCKVIYLGLISILFLFALIHEAVTPKQIGWKAPESRALQLYICGILFRSFCHGSHAGFRRLFRSTEGFITLIFILPYSYGSQCSVLNPPSFKGLL